MEFTLKIRIPGWANNMPVPGDLYTYTRGENSQIELKINGKVDSVEINSGYIVLERKWEKGDKIDLYIEMPVKQVVANKNVKADSAKMALERGPLVYCAESIDNSENILNLYLSDNIHWSAEKMSDLLRGITVIRGKAYYKSDLNQYTEKDFTAIPYYAWAHRGQSEMAVWFRILPDN
jgi:hypothetical protein